MLNWAKLSLLFCSYFSAKIISQKSVLFQFKLNRQSTEYRVSQITIILPWILHLQNKAFFHIDFFEMKHIYAFIYLFFWNETRLFIYFFIDFFRAKSMSLTKFWNPTWLKNRCTMLQLKTLSKVCNTSLY